jgi:DNA-binding LacI/PurR family transcriptional regulator
VNEKVTSFDVARRAGVSRSTVSVVLNRSYAVQLSEETRERVFRAAEDLGYRTNAAARMLVRGDTETIALVLSDPTILLEDAFVPQLLHGIRLVNRELGYHVLLDSLDPAGGRSTFKGMVASRRIDGMIVLNPRTDDPELRQLIDEGYPTVLVGSIRHPQEHSVNFSTREGIHAAALHLMDGGHTRIGMVTFSPRGLVATDVRIATLRRSLSGRGLSLADEDITEGAFSVPSGFDATYSLLSRRPDLTAVFAGNDTIAIGVLSAARALGRKVPDDLSIVGFDDLPFARFLDPALTTIRTNGVDHGMKAANLLIRILRGEPIEQQRLQSPTELIIRGSTAPIDRSSAS